MKNFMIQGASNVKSSSSDNSRAGALNDSCPTIILSNVCTANESLDERPNGQCSLTRRTEDYDASMTVQRISLQVEKIVVESK